MPTSSIHKRSNSPTKRITNSRAVWSSKATPTARSSNTPRTRQFHGDTYEGLAASLMEADLLRQKGDLDAALLGYRRVLESYAVIPVYRSHVLPSQSFAIT